MDGWMKEGRKDHPRIFTNSTKGGERKKRSEEKNLFFFLASYLPSVCVHSF